MKPCCGESLGHSEMEPPHVRFLRRVLPTAIRSRIGPPMRRLVARTKRGFETRVKHSNSVQWRGYAQRWTAYTLGGLGQRISRDNGAALSIQYDPTGTRLSGWHQYGSFWWLDPRSPFAFRYAELDALYPRAYFDRDAHPDSTRSRELVTWMREEYRRLAGAELKTVLELGSGPGNIALSLAEAGVSCTTVEGTASGCARLAAGGIPAEQIILADLRTWKGLDASFDMVMCTEVLEHIELPFLGRAVQQACAHADYVWFSSPSPDVQDSPKRLWCYGDYEHCSCMPLSFWDELFSFCGMHEYVVLDPIDCTKRGMRLYYREKARPSGARRD